MESLRAALGKTDEKNLYEIEEFKKVYKKMAEELRNDLNLTKAQIWSHVEMQRDKTGQLPTYLNYYK